MSGLTYISSNFAKNTPSENFYFNLQGRIGDDMGTYMHSKYIASSTYDEFSQKYDVDNLSITHDVAEVIIDSFDDCWCEGIDGNGIGEKIEISTFATTPNVSNNSGRRWNDTYRDSDVFEDMVDYLLSSDLAKTNLRYSEIITENNVKNYYSEIYQINIINGYAKTEELWKKNNRVKKLKLTIDDKVEYILELDDVMDVQLFNINYKNDCVTEKINMEFEILDVYQGEQCDDTCLTLIDIVGDCNVPWGGI